MISNEEIRSMGGEGGGPGKNIRSVPSVCIIVT